MPCKIIYSPEGNISRVNQPNGVESQLYIAIAKSVIANDPLATYKNKYSDKFKDINEDQISFQYRVAGENYISYKEALNAAQENQKIEAGFLVENDFTSLIETNKSTDKSSLQGYINSAITDDLLSEEKVKVGDEYFYQAFGQDDFSKAVNAETLAVEAIPHLGIAGVEKIGNGFRLSNKKETRGVLNKQNEIVGRTQTQLDNLTPQELSQQFEYPQDIILSRELEAVTPAYRENDLEDDNLRVDLSEQQLQLRLLSLLNKLGVKAVSLSNYVKNYQVRNGVNPSAQALADIANRVVAFNDGMLNTADLTEEVSHFIVEALPQQETSDVLRNIHLSEEYKQFSDVYREIYKDEYPAAELEEVVRREVLGKLVANSIAENFSLENKSEVQQNFVQKALEFVQSFFTTIRNYFQPQYKQELNNYLQMVQDALNQEELTDKVNTDNFTANKFRFYSVDSQNNPQNNLRRTLRKVVEDLTIQERALRQTGAGSKLNTLTIKNLQRELESAIEKSSVAELMATAKHSANYIRKAIEDSRAKNKSYFLSSEENIVYQNLIKSLKPSLSDIAREVENKEGWGDIATIARETVLEIDKLESEGRAISNQTVQKWIDDLIEKHDWPEDYRSYIENWLTNAQSDTNALHLWFGQLSHAKDSMLGLLGYVIKYMNNEHHQEWISDINPLIQTMERLGLSAQDINKFYKNGYLLNERDMSKFEEDTNNNFIQAYRQVTSSTLTNEQIIEKRDARTLELTDEQETEVRRIESDLNNPLRERMMNDSYYEEMEQRMQEAQVSEITRSYLSAYLSDVSQIKQKAKLPNGRTDITQLNLQDRQRLEDLEEKRKFVKSSFDETGQLKNGIVYRRNSQGEIETDERGNPLFDLTSTPSEAAIVALDIQRLDSSFAQTADREIRDIPEAFYDELTRVESQYGREEALNFLNLNSFTGFSSEFWDGLGGGASIVEKLQSSRNSSPENAVEIDRIIEDIQTFNSRMKGVLRLFSRKNNPSEIGAEKMSEIARDSVKTYQESLSELYDRARKFVEIDNAEQEASEDELVQGVSAANESFNKELINQGLFIERTDNEKTALEKLKKQVEFIKSHVTDKNRKLITEAGYTIDDFRAGKRKTLPQSIERTLERYDLSPDDLLDDATYIAFMQNYAQAKLLPYYKRFTPQSYDNFRDRLLNPAENIVDIVREVVADTDSYIEITPNASFYDLENNENLNPNFDKTYKGGYLQPKLSRYKDAEFTNLFGTVQKDEEGNLISAEKNENLFEAYKAVVKLNFKRLDDSQVSSGYNYYTTPQIRKGTVERTQKLFTGLSVQRLKDAFHNATNFTEDDMETGDNRFSTTVNTIPQQYVQKIPKSDLSNELFYSLMMGAKASTQRKARVKYYGDIMALQDTMIKRDYNGKPPEATNTVKMAKSAIDDSLFGIKEVLTYPVETPFGTVDLAKIGKNIVNYIKLRNLGFNVIIPITGALTGKATAFIESRVGDLLHVRSNKLGRAEMRRLMPDAMKELGEINPKAKLNVLGRAFKAFDMDESFKNSGYGKVFRVLSRTGMGLHAASNFPIYAETLMSVLHDFRVSNKKVINFTTFRAQEINKGKSIKELKTEWNTLEDKVFYNFIDIKNGEMTIDKERLSSELGLEGEALDKYVEDLVNRVSIFASYVNERVDSQMSPDDRAQIQRSFIGSLTFLHRSWLSLTVANRLKPRQLSFSSGQFEEGNFRTAWNFAGRYINEYKGKQFANFIKNFKELYDNASDLERRNLRKTGIEMGLLNVGIAIAYVLYSFADEPENEELFPLQLVSYLTQRLANELSSAQLAIIPSVSDAISSPILAYDSILSTIDITQAFSSDIVEGSAFAGHSQSFRYWTKVVPGAKSYYDLTQLNKTRTTYDYFNAESVENWTGMGLLYSNVITEEEE